MPVGKEVVPAKKQTPQLSPGRFQRQNCSFLEQIPEKLVVDFVMELHLLRLDESP
jgi:hypothetical protein